LKIAITGGSGFIGRLLAEECVRIGHEVRVLSRDRKLAINGTTTFYGDLLNLDCDFSAFVKDVDVLYHCAGEVVNKSLMHDVHITGSSRLIEFAKSKVKLWVQLSSVGAYGNPQQQLITESTLEAPVNIYEITKTTFDNVVKTSGIPFVIIRPSNVFGLSMKNRSLFQLINVIEKGLFFYIGRSGSIVNYIDVSDVVKAMVICGYNKNAIGNTYVLSQNITIEKMVEAFRKTLKLNGKVRRFPKLIIQITVLLFGEIPKFPLNRNRVNALTGRRYYNSEKIVEELDFKFGAPLETQLKSMLINDKK